VGCVDEDSMTEDKASAETRPMRRRAWKIAKES
jgi:hypothetical protein